jgi:hypothetical protein
VASVLFQRGSRRPLRVGRSVSLGLGPGPRRVQGWPLMRHSLRGPERRIRRSKGISGGRDAATKRPGSMDVGKGP